MPHVHLLDSIAISINARRCTSSRSRHCAPGSFGTREWWDHLDFLSTAGNCFDADYSAPTSKLPMSMRRERLKDGEDDDETMFNVCRRDNGTVRHFGETN